MTSQYNILQRVKVKRPAKEDKAKLPSYGVSTTREESRSTVPYIQLLYRRITTIIGTTKLIP